MNSEEFATLNGHYYSPEFEMESEGMMKAMPRILWMTPFAFESLTYP